MTEYIKAEAECLGFSACGIAKAEPVDGVHADAFRDWISGNFNASMSYMANWMELRLDPRKLMEGCRSVISLALNYCPPTKLPDDRYQFSYYAYGKDYHDVMKRLMRILQTHILEFAEGIPDIDATSLDFRICCDTAPILDRYWAWCSGIGWIGKNTNLIIPRAGSFFFLGEILVNMELEYGSPLEQRCGSCRACIDACPAKALSHPYRLDANRCLSYLTIENRGDIPEDMIPCMGNCVYGCDRCQQACPHNRWATPTEVQEFMPSERFMSMDNASWEALTVDDYREIFRGSAVKRAKYEGLMRNISAVAKNSGR